MSALVTDVRVTDHALVLEDGCEISAPLAWYPRLSDATLAARNKWRLIRRSEGIHWPEVDEDISVIGLLSGR